MSRELQDLSTQIDEAFDLEDVETTDFWIEIMALFA